MIDCPSPQKWAELRRRPPFGEGSLSTIPIVDAGIDTGLSIAIDNVQSLHLLIPVDSGPNGQRTPDLNGLKVRHLHTSSGQFLDLVADPAHERVFTPFCIEIVQAVCEQKRNPWMAVAASIRAWQSAWKPIRPFMERTAQVGMYGELFILRSVLMPMLGPKAVSFWSGPEAERHDFVMGQMHLEVKTTRRSRHEHEISRLDQLRVPDGRQLLVASVLVEESIGGAETLATEIDKIVDELRPSPAELDEFLTKVQRVGWSDEMRRNGELVRVNLREAFIYAVDENFPKLPDNFTPPSGVTSVRYSIDLANLPALGIDEVAAMLKSAAV